MPDGGPDQSFVDPDTGAHYDDPRNIYTDPEGYEHRDLDYLAAFNLNESFREKNRKVANDMAADLIGESEDEDEGMRIIKPNKNGVLHVAGMDLKLDSDLKFVDAFEDVDGKWGSVIVKHKTRLYGELEGTINVEDGKIEMRKVMIDGDLDDSDEELWMYFEPYYSSEDKTVSLLPIYQEVSGDDTVEVSLFRDKGGKTPYMKKYALDVPEGMKIEFAQDADGLGGDFLFSQKTGEFTSVSGNLSIDHHGKLLFLEESNEEFASKYSVTLKGATIVIEPL